MSSQLPHAEVEEGDIIQETSNEDDPPRQLTYCAANDSGSTSIYRSANELPQTLNGGWRLAIPQRSPSFVVGTPTTDKERQIINDLMLEDTDGLYSFRHNERVGDELARLYCQSRIVR